MSQTHSEKLVKGTGGRLGRIKKTNKNSSGNGLLGEREHPPEPGLCGKKVPEKGKLFH